MVAKAEIIERLGERAVLLPALIEDALAANDRLKVRLSLLQQAAAEAAEPGRAAPTMARELADVGLSAATFAVMISGARALDAGAFVAPGAAELSAGMADDLARMLAPLAVADAKRAEPLEVRAKAQLAALPAFADDHVANVDVARLGSARRDDGDTLHLLVMDLHKEINRVAAEAAVEEIDGARVHGLNDADRARVKAFMSGLNRTAGLAFGHPGLGTTAGRVGQRLTLQNDIGATDAHVLVVHVDGLTATTIYSDVHRIRAKFFIDLFADEAVDWGKLAEDQDRNLAKGEAFYLLNGAYHAKNERDLERFLAFLGSRLVFLIDWNKARKALQAFVPKGRAVDILTAAARADDGHRAFLELGGAELVFEAVRRVGAGHVAYGVPLHEALGEPECVSFLTRVLRIAREGLMAGRSDRLIRDEIQTELSDRFDTAESALLATVLRHLGLTRTLAGMIETVFDPDGLASLADRQALARRAKQLEAKGDRLTLAARDIAARLRDSNALLPLIDQAENALDEFDETAFLLSLAPENANADALSQPLSELAGIAKDSVAHLVRAVEAAALIPDGKRIDVAFALQSLDAALDAERAADAAERSAITAIMQAAPAGADARALVLGLEIARTLEETTDRIAHAAMSLRDRIIQGLSA